MHSIVCTVGEGDPSFHRESIAPLSLSILQSTVAKSQSHNFAVVFDIDDTLVDESEVPLPSIINIYLEALRMGIHVFLVTARSESYRKPTINMLHSKGIREYRRLYMIPDDYKSTFEEIARFKRIARDHIAKNFSLIGSFGDMWSDHIDLGNASEVQRNLMRTGSSKRSFAWLEPRGDGTSILHVKLPHSED